MANPATPDYPIHDLLRQRYSPRALVPREMDAALLRQLFEAARWTASSMNEQPWRFVVAPRSDADAFGRLLACLSQGNRQWAHDAGALVAVLVAENLRRTGQPNLHAWYDVGAAVAQLTVQATALGLGLRQMGGIDHAALRAALQVPSGVATVAVLAIGYPGEAEQLPAELQAKERAPRTRLPQAEWVFGGRFGERW